MSSVWARVEPLLARVQKPARYIGCEDGAIAPEQEIFGPEGPVAWPLAYPDIYEIGLPNQGLQTLYEIFNERPDAVAERIYAPWQDLNAQMRSHSVPLFSEESHRPAAEFDLSAFNLSSELVFTNLLEMLDLADVPIHPERRAPADPLVIDGGFVPTPHTPFRWFGQNTENELHRQISLVRNATHKVRDVNLVWYVHRHRRADEILPGDHLTASLHKDFLWDDWQAALHEHGVEDLRWTRCYDCGVHTGFGIEPIVASNTPPAGGSQGTGQDLSGGGPIPVSVAPVLTGARS